MQETDFSSSKPGRLIKNLEGRTIFVPDTLYPKAALTSTEPQLFEQVTVHLARLDGMTRLLPDPTILIRSFVRREAQLSSYIENTFANYDEIAEAERDNQRQQVKTQALETLNAEHAILAGLDAVNKRQQPVTNSLIRQLHEILLNDVRGHECRGRYRQKQVYIGNEPLGIDSARFVPPASHLVPELMDQFENAWRGGNEYVSIVSNPKCRHYGLGNASRSHTPSGSVARLISRDSSLLEVISTDRTWQGYSATLARLWCRRPFSCVLLLLKWMCPDSTQRTRGCRSSS